VLSDCNFWVEYWCRALSRWRTATDVDGYELCAATVAQAVTLVYKWLPLGTPARVVNHTGVVYWQR